MVIKIPKGKIYKGRKGWRVRGFTGTSYTKEQAERRYINWRERNKGLRLLKRPYQVIKRQQKEAGGFYGLLGQVLSFESGKFRKKAEREIAREERKRYQALLKAKRQKTLSGWV